MPYALWLVYIATWDFLHDVPTHDGSRQFLGAPRELHREPLPLAFLGHVFVDGVQLAVSVIPSDNEERPLGLNNCPECNLAWKVVACKFDI